MNDGVIEGWAQDLAEAHLQQFEYLTIVEHYFDENQKDIDPDDANRIFHLIINAEVIL